MLLAIVSHEIVVLYKKQCIRNLFQFQPIKAKLLEKCSQISLIITLNNPKCSIVHALVLTL